QPALLLHLIPLHPTPTLFPYTTLFRSVALREPALSETGRLLAELATVVPRRECRWVRAEGLHLTLHFFGEHLAGPVLVELAAVGDRKSTRLNSSHSQTSYAVFCLQNTK